ncbi:MAG: hypothetical protein ACLFVU_09905 [Phycisphaerae bacterium]
MQTELFESPFYTVITLVIIELVILAVWYNTRKRWAALALIGPPILIAGLFWLASAVRTEREKILLNTYEIADAITAGDVDRAATYLDPRYDGDVGESKEQALDAGREAIRRFKISNVDFRSAPEIEVIGDEATMQADTFVKINASDLNISGAVRMVWTVRWVRRDEGWRIIHVEYQLKRTLE